MTSLYEDCRDGIAFLKVLDFLEPGSIRWAEVVREPRSIYERVQNCNRCVHAARQRGLHVEGIAGKDFADGLATYILSLASQLMRSHACQFLNDLGLGEADVLSWANCQVRRCDVDIAGMRSFGDPAIRNGVFLLQLLRSVAADCVKPELMLNGDTEYECQQNAKYAISCAHKMGSLVFATWEDIVEARPRSILCFLAAAMAEDLRRHDRASALAIT
jgi:plastin-1